MLARNLRELDSIPGAEVAIDQAQGGAVGQQHIGGPLGETALDEELRCSQWPAPVGQVNRSRSATAAINKSPV